MKITTEVRYNDMSFNFVKEVNNMKMYIDSYQTYAIIVDQEDEVLFEIRADCHQNVGYLEDSTQL